MTGWTAYLFVGANIALYALLALQLVRSRLQAPTRAETIGEAFALFGVEIRRSVPSIPPGFTWEEAVAQARKLSLAVDWPKLDEAVRTYEGYRYGGAGEPRAGYEEVSRLARELRRTR